MASPKLSF